MSPLYIDVPAGGLGMLKTRTILNPFHPIQYKLLLDFIDQKHFHSTEMNEGGKASEKALESLTETIGAKITKGFEESESLFSSACIYRVPEELRKQKESVYTPRLIAIGPLHRNDKHLQTSLQHVKSSYANFLFCRVTKGIEEEKSTKGIEEEKFRKLQECVAEMTPLIEDAKKCYAEEVTLDEEMLLVDGCFILELLYRFSLTAKEEEKPVKGEGSGKSKRPLGMEERIKTITTDSVFNSTLTANTLQHDLLLLENQIPFFVLEKLFQLTVAQIPERTHNSLTDYVSPYFAYMISLKSNSKRDDNATTTCYGSLCDVVLSISGNPKKNFKEEEENKYCGSNRAYYHILHNVYEDYLHPVPKKKGKHFEPMPSASNLDYAGIKFVPSTGDNLFNVKFIKPKGPFWWCQRARFKIPRLEIYHPTEAFLRNLIAFEQCWPGSSEHFTSYAYLMDMLVNSETDAKVLEKAGVVRNYLGASEEATDLFNKLCKEIMPGDFFFADECNDAIEYSQRCWPKYMAQLRRKYFASPWAFIGFCLASIIFGTTVTQFILSFLK